MISNGCGGSLQPERTRSRMVRWRCSRPSGTGDSSVADVQSQPTSGGTWFRTAHRPPNGRTLPAQSGRRKAAARRTGRRDRTRAGGSPSIWRPQACCGFGTCRTLSTYTRRVQWVTRPKAKADESANRPLRIGEEAVPITHRTMTAGTRRTQRVMRTRRIRATAPISGESHSERVRWERPAPAR
jgi:hypothetical protein